ncbi:MAG: hypothetical protein QOI41_2460 [Myxococcales bacterium]|nr:hypothetical protein [Myxococcales bacterium]
MVARIRRAPPVTSLRRVVVSVAIAGAFAAGIVMACGPGDLSDLTRGRADAAVVVGADVADVAICKHASAPERPNTPDGPSIPNLVFAFDGVRFDDGAEDSGPPRPVGLDLDRTCTCADPKLEPESCIPPDSGAVRPCDGVDGRDNAAGPLVAAASASGKGVGPEAFQSQVRAGAFNVLTTVSGWNGLPDDPSIIVGIQLSGGLEGSQSDAGRPQPKFDGTDVWTVMPASVLGGADLAGQDCRTIITGCLASKADTKAYVSGGVFVAHLDIALPIVTNNSSFTIEFVAATVTATLSRTANGYRSVGEIDGRWPIDRLLPSLARIPNPITPGRALCATDSGLEIYSLVKKSACEGMDLTANPALDRTNVPCDAISNAITFTGVSATIGTVYEPPSSNSDCADFHDTCATP